VAVSAVAIEGVGSRWRITAPEVMTAAGDALVLALRRDDNNSLLWQTSERAAMETIDWCAISYVVYKEVGFWSVLYAEYTGRGAATSDVWRRLRCWQ
jgi:hypothetical protein